MQPGSPLESGAEPERLVDTHAPAPTPAAPADDDAAFSEMMARWLDEGDRLGGAAATAEPHGDAPAAAKSRWAGHRQRAWSHATAFAARFRADGFRFRALIAGAAGASLLFVLVLRHQAGTAPAMATAAEAAAPSRATPVVPAPAAPVPAEARPTLEPPAIIVQAQVQAQHPRHRRHHRARPGAVSKHAAITLAARDPRGTSPAVAHPASGSSRSARTSGTGARR
jgi:hypothetical protein